MIDKEQFKENFQYYDKEVIVEIIDIFFSEYPERLVSLQKCIEESDFEMLNRKAHSLKGVVAYMSQDLYKQCELLERKGKECDTTDLQQLYDLLKISLLELVEELQELRKEYL